jgi:hypothetical protein
LINLNWIKDTRTLRSISRLAYRQRSNAIKSKRYNNLAVHLVRSYKGFLNKNVELCKIQNKLISKITINLIEFFFIKSRSEYSTCNRSKLCTPYLPHRCSKLGDQQHIHQPMWRIWSQSVRLAMHQFNIAHHLLDSYYLENI